jgi:hypothetical protein
VLEKEKTTEERRYEGKKELTKVTYEEPLIEEWGGTLPLITLEYDEKNCILLVITIKYNRREARKDSVLTLPELKQKILHELEKKDVFTGDDTLLHSQELESRAPNKKVTFMEPAEKAVV